MQLTLPLVMALASGFFLGAVADGDFRASCNSISLFDPKAWPGCHTSSCDHYMIDANCAYEDGTYNVDTSISLDLCIANANGVIQAQPNGGFTSSCPSASLSGTTLTTSCYNDGGSLVTSSLDCNNFIGNDNGIMCCFGLCG